MKKMIVFPALFIYLFFGSLCVYAENNKAEIAQLRKEMNELKNEFKTMKDYYERKITDLELKVYENDLNALPEKNYYTSSAESKPTSYSFNQSILNPNISAVADIKQRFNDDKGDENRSKLTVGEVELNVAGMVYPDVKGNLTASIETEYSGESDTSTDLDLEEGYIHFLSLPFNTQLIIGRKLIDFGLLNPVHTHEWAFPDMPLVLGNLFGHHPWNDDGIQGSIIIPNPWDIYWVAKFGVWNGRELHHHDDVLAASASTYNLQNSVVNWGDMVYTTRTNINIPLGDNSDMSIGYSSAWDERPNTVLHDFDFTLRYWWPLSYHRIKWQNEYIIAKIQNPKIEPQGFYSLLEYTVNKNWTVGTRWDYTQYNENDKFNQWANSYFLTYYFNHGLYARVMYRYKDFADFPDMHQECDNTLWFQVVWGLGPHVHPVQE
ncbi:hypothetical protein J7L67_03290 [bacterium]|nr:hypothetical protein [bacterium]